MIIERAFGHTYVDTDGRHWVDLLSGTQNVPLGHQHMCVSRGLARVIASGAINTYGTESTERRDLLGLLKDTWPSFCWYPCTTGSEAVERALQCVYAAKLDWHGRVLYVPGSFHGKSFALARTRYQWGSSLLEPIVGDESFNTPFDAILYEPVQGMTGRVIDEVPLRTAANRMGACLIADEMITGFGRCGKPFLSEEADIIVCGKGISSGVPIALVASQVDLDIPTGWTTTSAGNALSCAIAFETLCELMLNPPNTRVLETCAINTFGQSFYGKGALWCIKVKDEKEAKRRLENHRYIATYSEGYIRMAPRLNFPLDELHDVTYHIRHNIIKDLLA